MNNGNINNNDVVYCHTFQAGVYLFNGGCKATHIAIKCGNNVTVTLTDDFGRKQKIKIERDFVLTAPEGTCLNGVEVKIHQGRAEIIYKKSFGLLLPYNIPIQNDRRKLLLKN